MKSMVMMLCAVLSFVSVGVAQNNDWLSGTWKGFRKLEFVANPNFRQRQALNSPGSETVSRVKIQPGNESDHGEGRGAKPAACQ